MPHTRLSDVDTALDVGLPTLEDVLLTLRNAFHRSCVDDYLMTCDSRVNGRGVSDIAENISQMGKAFSHTRLKEL